MITADPAFIPVITPALFTVAIKLFEVDHTPPGVAELNVIVDASQTVFEPVSAATTGVGRTVTVITAELEVHPAAFVPCA